MAVIYDCHQLRSLSDSFRSRCILAAIWGSLFYSLFLIFKWKNMRNPWSLVIWVDFFWRAWKKKKRGVGPHADVTQTGPKQCSRFSSKSRCILNSKMLTLLYRVIIKEVLCQISGQYLDWFRCKYFLPCADKYRVHKKEHTRFSRISFVFDGQFERKIAYFKAR